MDKTISPSHVSGEVRPPLLQKLCTARPGRRAAERRRNDAQQHRTVRRHPICHGCHHPSRRRTAPDRPHRVCHPGRTGSAHRPDQYGRIGPGHPAVHPGSRPVRPRNHHHRQRYHAAPPDRHDDRAATQPGRRGRLERLPPHRRSRPAAGRAKQMWTPRSVSAVSDGPADGPAAGGRRHHSPCRTAQQPALPGRHGRSGRQVQDPHGAQQLPRVFHPRRPALRPHQTAHRR